VHLAVRGAVLRSPPGKAHHHILARGGARQGEALRLCCKQAHTRACTGHVRPVPGSTRSRKDTIERWHGLIPSKIVVHHEQIATVGTGQEFRVVEDALVGVSSLWGSHGRLFTRVLSTLAEFEGQCLAHDNPISLTGLLLRYCVNNFLTRKLPFPGGIRWSKKSEPKQV
jgi:hypothetical protein